MSALPAGFTGQALEPTEDITSYPPFNYIHGDM